MIKRCDARKSSLRLSGFPLEILPLYALRALAKEQRCGDTGNAVSLPPTASHRLTARDRRAFGKQNKGVLGL